MKRTLIASSLGVLMLSICGIANAQDFQKSYTLAAGGRVSLKNSSGSIHVSSYGGSEVKVSAFREGRNADRLYIQDDSTATAIDLRVHYPNFNVCFFNCNSRMRIEVQVPDGLKLNYDEVSTASGEISIEKAAGELKVHSSSGRIELNGINGNVTAHAASGRIELNGINGNVTAHAASGSISINGATGNVGVSTASGKIRAVGIDGALTCKAASGRVEAGIARLEPSGNVHISTASGSVSLSLPERVDAEVNLSTHSGHVRCDLPIQIRKMGHGHEINGTIGSGSGASRIEISSASGSIDLKRSAASS